MEIKKVQRYFSTIYDIRVEPSTDGRRDARNFMERKIRRFRASVPSGRDNKNIPYSRKNARFAVGHELGHAEQDPQTNRFVLFIDAVGDNESGVFASRLAYGENLDRREPEELMRIAKGRSKKEMSPQDKKWYRLGKSRLRKS